MERAIKREGIWCTWVTKVNDKDGVNKGGDSDEEGGNMVFLGD